ncbi:hypothetical protein [uncultured Thiodictyon sp.]|uniref:hypothetical protein n=1 Tax=uncultured Thiodictyon sp. TaxID=1846217 RepID=UPI0025F990C4|nr:hypothetical protein [uncultured Thiodictyon sp.]
MPVAWVECREQGGAIPPSLTCQFRAPAPAAFKAERHETQGRPRVAAGNVHRLLIADEVHNLGAENARAVLPDGITLRLGLSATPERHFDPAGTAAVLDYFGAIVYQYTLAQAIADGRLCRYRYYPVLVDLTDAEADEYLENTTRLARFYHGDTGNAELDQAALRLLMRRARLVGAAANVDMIRCYSTRTAGGSHRCQHSC